ncbi:MAG: valine--tRNA ligase [Planctomycetes bacterium]|nr:valine--tRNA ligase [Planctomycetota bacterium]
MPPLDLPKSYDAKSHEVDVYQRWEGAGCFKAGAGHRDGKPSYTIAIPPPNVTGVLHMGHALNNTLQDTLIRWRRMQGRDVLWQPGMDHAGIATEAVVAKQLEAEGKRKEQTPRDEFIARIWAWKEQSGGTIVKQLRKLGSSCDWSRERFTMDPGLSRAVRTMFKKMVDADLIYRGTRMVNWSPVLKTALSDDEVDVKDKQGHLWKLRYDLADGSGSIAVETTRPETFFGDSAVAVNPSDERYRALIGSMVKLPIIGREIPIVADEHADPGKGTGAVKITPAHDPNDYEVGKRHGLPLIRVIGLDGAMTALCAHFAGMDRFACRKALLKEFEASGVLLGATEITHAVGHSERSGEPIEPMVTEQWFVRMAPLAARAVAETRADRLHFHPERWTKVYEHWLDNVRDWCISRQIWWGHRIPAWHCASCAKITVPDADAPDPTACAHCGAATVTQDPDVLDTWFSSALWPYSTLGWPDATPEMSRYFPTATLVTDRGIIFFWVARMVMTSLFALDKRPFSDVYIHGTVNDERGDKMSKSKGNGIDPIIMIEGGVQHYLGKDYQCPGYGADAVRYTLLDMTTEGQDLKLSPSRFETGRNFANKVWNAGRFLLMNLSERPLANPPTAQDLLARELGFPERWLLDRLQAATNDCTRALDGWRFNDYANGAYRFFRDDLCDWYVEWAKRAFKSGGDGAQTAALVLWYAFERTLRLLHPGMPFITEYLWQQLQTTAGGQPWTAGRFLMLQAWPEVEQVLADASAGARMDELQQLVIAVRNTRNQQGVADGTALAVSIATPDAAKARALEADRDFLIDRGNFSALAIAVDAAKPAAAVTSVVGALKVHVSLEGQVDLAKLKDQLTKRTQQLEKSIAGKQGRLGNADYIARAPAAQVEETKAMLAKEQAEVVTIRETLAGLG